MSANLPSCTTCDLQLAPHRRPTIADESKCSHPNSTCRACWRTWLEEQLKSLSPANITCIQCENILSQAEVRAIASQELFDRYLDLELKAALSVNNDFRHCIAPGCKSGQLHDGGEIFICTGCGLKHCVPCQAPWHAGTTCEALQAARMEDLRLKDKKKQVREEETASVETIQKTTKECPSCKRNIEKNGGCEHMRCSQCKHEFCWLCLADYNAIRHGDNSAHERDCLHWRSPGGGRAQGVVRETLAYEPRGYLEGFVYDEGGNGWFD